MKSRLMAIFLLILFLTLLLHWIVLSPLSASYHDLQSEFKRSVRAAQTKRRSLKDFHYLKSSVQRLDRRLAKKRQQFISKSELALVFDAFHQAATEVGLEIKQRFEREKPLYDGIYKQPVNMMLSGSLKQFLNFFKQTEKWPSLFYIHDFIFQKGQAKDRLFLKLTFFSEDLNHPLKPTTIPLLKPITYFQNQKKNNPLYNHPLKSLVFVGVIKDQLKKWALIQIPSGFVDSASIGDYLGQEKAVIQTISNRVICVQTKRGVVMLTIKGLVLPKGESNC